MSYILMCILLYNWIGHVHIQWEPGQGVRAVRSSTCVYVCVHLCTHMCAHCFKMNWTYTHWVRAGSGGTRRTCVHWSCEHVCVCIHAYMYTTDIHKDTHTLHYNWTHVYTLSESPVKGYALYVCAWLKLHTHRQTNTYTYTLEHILIHLCIIDVHIQWEPGQGVRAVRGCTCVCVCVQTYIKIHIQHAVHPHVHYNRTHTHWVRARLGGTCCTKLYNYMCVCLCTDIHEYTHTIYHTSSYAHCITIELDAYTMSESPVRGYTLYVCASKLCIHVYLNI